MNKYFFYAIILLLLQTSSIYSKDITDIRRRDQFDSKFSYAVLPIPYSIPGIGDGLGIGVAVNNINNSMLDTYTLGISGDIEGFALGVSDYYLLPKRFYVNAGISYLSKASFAINPSRGMKGSEDPDDFNVAEISDTYGGGIDATLTFLERILDFNVNIYSTRSKISNIRDKDGNLLIKADAQSDIEHVLGAGINLDLTDDRKDPKSGFRLNLSANMPLNVDNDSARSYVVDINSTAYVPILKYSTVVFNCFISDSHVLSEGETDRSVIESDYGLDVTPGDTEAEAARDQMIDNIIAANKYGNASSLGGLSRLRSYKSMRFRGAHSRFAGIEFRLNMTDENTPFNIWIIRDIRTSFQLALFHEAGTIADRESELYDEIKHSTGIGLRMVVNSGLVFRIDLATGSEGEEVAMFLDYPWTFF